MNEEQIAEVRRVRSAGKLIKNEVLVVFIDLESRDTVTSYARNLASQKDAQGNPTAGLRLDIPSQLMGIFKLLEAHGRKLRARYGPDFKRHVRFDDSERSLFLNVKLPGEESWSHVSPSLARSIEKEDEQSAATRGRYGYSKPTGSPLIHGDGNRRPRTFESGR